MADSHKNHQKPFVDPAPSATWEERQQFDTATIDRQTLARLFPEFKLYDLIHQGGFGAVYLGQYRRTEKWVAFKILSKSQTASNEDYQKFQQDLNTVGKLSDPGVVKILVTGERNGILFLGQEWVDGIDLDRLLGENETLHPEQAVEIISQVAEVLEHAIKNGLRHQEIRPGNIMLEIVPEKRVKVRVLNLGLARMAEGEVSGFSLNMTGKFRGMVDYLAPEQVERPREVDERTDVYGLGASLYKLLTGMPPHGRETAEESPYQKILRLTKQDCSPIQELKPQISDSLAGLVHHMLSRQMENRPSGFAELLEMLKPFRKPGSLDGLVDQIVGRKRILPVIVNKPKAALVGDPVPALEKQPQVKLGPLILLVLIAVAAFFAWKFGIIR